MEGREPKERLFGLKNTLHKLHFYHKKIYICIRLTKQQQILTLLIIFKEKYPTRLEAIKSKNI